MKQYVQHKSGVGEKWLVIGQGGRTQQLEAEWTVNRAGYCYNLPKSEYIPCDPPEEWEDVTQDCYIPSSLGVFDPFYIIHSGFNTCIGHGYRVRKIEGIHNGPCFIVERKKS